MATEPSFEITASSDHRPGSTLVVGLSTPGLAGLTAADYLVRHLDAEEIGAVIPDGLPAIAPFEAGVPRHPTRLFDLVGRSLSVLVGELYVPPPIAHPFVDTLRGWAHSVGIEEVALLHGVPYPHDEAEHAVYHVATPGYRERHFADEAVPPLGGGVLDGVAGELVGRALEDDALEVGVYVTPTHPPGPDVEAALRLIDALEGRYGFEIDPAELEALADRLGRYHAELADRMEALAQAEAPIGSREFPEDRMYM